MRLSKADQYVEDYKRFEEHKEPNAPSFGIDGVPKVVVNTKRGDLLFNCGRIQKEHALAFAQWIIETYSVPAEPEPKPDWHTPVVGRKYKTRDGERAIVMRILTDAVLVMIDNDEDYISYDNFPSFHLKGDSCFNVVGFWEET